MHASDATRKHVLFWTSTDPRSVPSLKHCTACAKDQPRSAFLVRRARADGLSRFCGPCTRREAQANKTTRKKAAAATLKTTWDRHGLAISDRDVLLVEQDHKCALCFRVLSVGTARGCHIDHDHETGRIRGLLCGGCNTALGALGDTPEGLHRAHAYVCGSLPHGPALTKINSEREARAAAAKAEKADRAARLALGKTLLPDNTDTNTVNKQGLLFVFQIDKRDVRRWMASGCPVLFIPRNFGPGMGYLFSLRAVSIWLLSWAPTAKMHASTRRRLLTTAAAILNPEADQ